LNRSCGPCSETAWPGMLLNGFLKKAIGRRAQQNSPRPFQSLDLELSKYLGLEEDAFESILGKIP